MVVLVHQAQEWFAADCGTNLDGASDFLESRLQKSRAKAGGDGTVRTADLHQGLTLALVILAAPIQVSRFGLQLQ